MLDVEETVAFLSCDATELLVEMFRRDGVTNYRGGAVLVGDHAMAFVEIDSWLEATSELCLLRLAESTGPFRYRMTLAGAKVAVAIDPVLVEV